MTTWFLVADASRSRILETSLSDPSLREIDARIHPASRMHTSELVADGAGRTMKGLGRETHSAMEPRTSRHEVEVRAFALDLVHHLNESLRAGRFDALVIVSPPRFLGILRENLTHELLAVVTATVAKDYTHSSVSQLRDGLELHGSWKPVGIKS